MTVLPDDGFPLAAAFPDATHEQWQQLVAGVLRKAGREVPDTAEDALSTPLEDGLRTLPLYTARDTAPNGLPDPGLPGFAPFTRGGTPAGGAVHGWDVRSRLDGPDAARTNAAALADLEGGATSLWLTAGPSGVPVSDLDRALDGVRLDAAGVVLDAGAEFAPAAHALLRRYARTGGAPEAARGVLGADPLGVLARTGDGTPLPGLLGQAAELAERCVAHHPGVRALVVDALPYHEAGGSPAQELGCALATGLAYLRTLTDAGVGVAAACDQLEFRYAATADQFLTIAKLRAARRLWSRVTEACGAPGAGAQRQHAVTSPVMMTRRDPWVNMLRTTVACLAAGTGGADAVTVLPFDAALGLPDAFARRIARNTSLILVQESQLGRVVDPAGGSWYVESLTEDLARAAWSWFQEIERAGGQAAALESGLVKERLAASWQRRRRDLDRRAEPITGVSEFPLLSEEPLRREPAPAPAGGGLPRVRRDEAYEALRARSDAHQAATGARPRVFLAALGPPAAHTARATFAANLFQAGGVEPVQEPVTVDAATVAAAFGASGAGVACLCSDDQRYAEEAAEVAAALKAAGARWVALAGRPGAREAELREAGVDAFVALGVDAVAVLTEVLDRMEVA